MTENEAIKKLNMLDEALNFQRYDADECSCALQMAIQALEEIQQYRAIGTVEDIEKGIRQSEEEFDMLMEYRKIGTIDEFKDLKEKNTKKRFNIFESCGMRQFVCGCCDRPILTTDNYCSFCGQKIDWQ